MGAISGKGGRVLYGSVVVANINTWSMSGFTVATAEASAFGTDIKKFLVSDAGDPGIISFSGNYDPTDSGGQAALAAICELGTELTNLYLYANTSTFWRVGTSGVIIVTKADAVTLPRSGIGSISFEGKVSADGMEQVGTGT